MRRTRLALLVWLCAAGCTSPVPVSDPLATLKDPAVSIRKHAGAMAALDESPTDPEYLAALEGMLWRNGYTVAAREEAFVRLERVDPERLKRVIRQQLPRMGARAWQEQLCELIADRGWVELTPAVVSAWSQKIGFVDDLDRVEYKVLVRLHGQDHVVDVVFDLMVSSNKAYEQPLRGRCWDLLIRLGEQDRITALLADETVAPDDAALQDLRAAAIELAIVPRTREEILWVRKLREPERADFWSQAAAVVASLPPERREELELRDLPILVAASLHDPWLLEADRDELYERVRAHVNSTRVHVDPDRFEGFPGAYPQRLAEQRNRLDWGDLAAMVLAVRAAQVPQVTEHLFEYADRDLADESCEYGGIIALDDQGRFEVLEFPPRFRRRDTEFIASQEMLDAAYTAVFHFHFHAQKHHNGRYACPGIGDLNYADNLRPNCLVFTFIDSDTLNVDYYRYDRMIVDLGEIRRVGNGSS